MTGCRFFVYVCTPKKNIVMSFFNIQKHESREFKYKPRYYTPEDQKPTDNHRRDFADELHREWQGKRRHDRNERKTPWLTLLAMVFFAIVIALVYFKFFA